MPAVNYQGKESEQSKARAKKKKKVKSGLTAEQLVAGMQGNRSRMPMLGAEAVLKRKKRR